MQDRKKDDTLLSSDYLKELEQIDRSTLIFRIKYIQLKKILEQICRDITQSELLQFPSLFSRLVFISQRYNLPKSLEWQLHNIRVKTSFLMKDEKNLISVSEYKNASDSIRYLISTIDGKQSDKHDLPIHITQQNTGVTYTFSKLRVQIVGLDKDQELIYCKTDSIDSNLLLVKYNIPIINDLFNATIDRLWIGAQLNLIDGTVDKDGYCICKAFVLEPDYLIDASSLAECFQNYGYSHLHYFRRKFESVPNSHYILLGNLANFFLDELIYADNREELPFDDVFLKSFKQSPFEYTACTDIKSNEGFKDFMQRAQKQFKNIKRVILNDIPANGFTVEECILEPSFFCEKYGFQGRLDLLQPNEKKEDISRIIELKSGKPPYPQDDTNKIAINHEAQTAIYRMIVQTVFDLKARQIYPTILYSASEQVSTNMRLAAPYQKLEKEILNIRNLIIANEHDIYTGDIQTVENIFNKVLDSNSYGRIPQFFTDRLRQIAEALQGSTELEKKYFYRYISFVTRELYLQKVGDENYDSYSSLAALWNTEFVERKDSLDLLSDLTIEKIEENERDMTILFGRKDKTDFVNFREGEICILYPHDEISDTVLANQILKGTIAQITNTHILLRFRYKQRNKNFFSKHQYWVVEHDKLDHTYNAMFKSLFSFLLAPQKKKDLLLGLRKPSSYLNNFVEDPSFTKDQKKNLVIDKALAAEDYFLIVGPPGTGKTSIFARSIIEKLHQDKDINILVMAYTNKAVDELCEAICNAFGENVDTCKSYIRVGTELSCGYAYRHRLLQNVSQTVKNRQELMKCINNTRIFIGTLASIVGKPELMNIKKFNVAIVDEASQILEPQIIGLLPLFDRFILIGDHKQLSTITLQDESKSEVTDNELNNIELYNCRESLFERLFRICQNNKWLQAYDTLTYHGRMHRDIANFVNIHFYDNTLKIADFRQSEPLKYKLFDETNHYQSLIANKRVSFIHCSGDNQNTWISDKINHNEADIVVNICRNLYTMYKNNGLEFYPERTIGIIAPYRNQIALIKHKLEESGIDAFKQIMVDTVERYQGSQKDIIIISFCFNKAYQIKYFSNMNREKTVDRKLNVALTRAREQLFLIGNEYILRQYPIYQKLLESIQQ